MKQEKTVGVIDFGLGNLKSVSSAIKKVGGKSIVSSDLYSLEKCDKLILPGVGAFKYAMGQLQDRKIDALIRAQAQKGVPILGICLGMQLLTEKSYEFGETKGLGLVAGIVKKFDSPKGKKEIRLPNVSWSALDSYSNKTDWLFEGLTGKERYYFIHSFACLEKFTNTTKVSSYLNQSFAAVICKRNVIGTQFHPEKSGPAGLRLLKNFLERENWND